MTLLEAILDATKRRWAVTFAEDGNRLWITARRHHDGKVFMHQCAFEPGESEEHMANMIVMRITNDRQLPPTEAEQLQQAIEERARRDPGAPGVIARGLW